MSESILTFKYLSHTQRDDGTIASYTIEVTNTHSDKVEVFQIEPRHLASAHEATSFTPVHALHRKAKEA